MDIDLAIQLKVELIAQVLVEKTSLLGSTRFDALDDEFLKQLLDTLVELQLGLLWVNIAPDYLDELPVEFGGGGL